MTVIGQSYCSLLVGCQAEWAMWLKSLCGNAVFEPFCRARLQAGTSCLAIQRRREQRIASDFRLRVALLRRSLVQRSRFYFADPERRPRGRRAAARSLVEW